MTDEGLAGGETAGEGPAGGETAGEGPAGGETTDGETTDGAEANDGEEPGADGRLTIALIAAVAANGVIGAERGMPWHLPADLRHFKETTTGHPVILGRVTYESIAADLGGPLPGRTSVVLSRSDPDLPDGAAVVGSVEEALEAARRDAAERGVDTVYVAGGARVYEQFLPLADRLVLTEIDEPYEGDTVFPEFEREPEGTEGSGRTGSAARSGDATRERGAWVEVERDERDGFAFVVYERAE